VILVAIKSYEEQLEEVQKAISAVMNGQEYQLGRMRMRKADLQFLHQREIYLRAMIEREKHGTRTLAGWGK